MCRLRKGRTTFYGTHFCLTPVSKSAGSRSGGRMSGKQQLEDQTWYHGLLPRSEITELLKRHGDWLVRCTEKNKQFKVVISVNWKGEFKHVMLRREKAGWPMPDDKVYANIPDLIEAFRNHKQPLNESGVTLSGRAIDRPKWMISKKDVYKEEKLGEGAFGEVFRGKLKLKGKQIPVALKSCKALTNTKEREEFLGEAKQMLRYKHRNVVQLYGVAADKPPMMLVMEYCPDGALKKYLQKNTVGKETKIRFCVEAVRGLEYLAVNKNCIHRDLAARNCLLGLKGEVKVSDFGLTRKGEYQIKDMKKARLPILWSAPEALMKGKFSKASDMWSFGILMWEIFADGKNPWPGMNTKEAYGAMKQGKKMDMPKGTDVPQAIQKLMKQCWELKPENRPTSTEVKGGLEKVAKALNIDTGSAYSSSRSTTTMEATQRTAHF